jgi:superfamily II DNA or RNA helicase
VVSGLLRRGDDERPLQAPRLLVDRFVFFDSEAARFDAGAGWPWIVDLRRNGELRVPASQANTLLESLVESVPLECCELDAPLRLEVVREAPRPCLLVKAVRYPSAPRLDCALAYEYGGVSVPAADARTRIVDLKVRRVIVRDADAESALWQRLREAGISGRREAPGIVPRKLPAVVRALLAEGWRVTAEGKLYRSAATLSMQVTSGIDWFDLTGEVDFEGLKAPLPEVLAALARGETTIALGDGGIGLLPEEWLRRYALFGHMGRREATGLRYERNQLTVLDALLAEERAAKVDAKFARARERLRAFAGVSPADPPPAFTGRLRPYQRDGLGWLQFLQQFGFGGCLADDMGLGKTVQVLALLAGRSACGPTLVVAPRSVVFNWKQEAQRFTPELRVLDHTGAARPKDAAGFADANLVLTTYGTLRRDARLFAACEFDYVVLDEAQAIKNERSESAKAARLLKGAHRLALSGTPVENHLGELWSLFEFLNPGMLGRSAALGAVAAPGSEARASLSRALRPFLLRRTKEQVLQDLPPKTEQRLACELGSAQRRLYEELRTHYRSTLLGRIERDGIARSKLHILEGLLRLRQVACHPGLVDRKRSGEESAKLETLLPALAEVVAEGHKALVFSQFTSFLDIVERRLDEAGIRYVRLDGRTRDRAARVERFERDAACPVFLVSLKAGGLGLNLTAADYVFILDPWWNPAVEAQAVDRSHRIGQRRPVFAYRLIATGTVEEKVLQLQDAKRALVADLFGEDTGVIRGLDRETLEQLLS